MLNSKTQLEAPAKQKYLQTSSSAKTVLYSYFWYSLIMKMKSFRQVIIKKYFLRWWIFFSNTYQFGQWKAKSVTDEDINLHMMKPLSPKMKILYYEKRRSYMTSDNSILKTNTS